MTISNTDWQVSVQGDNSVGQEVPFTFPITNTSDLVVQSRVTATGSVTTLTETTNYTVAIDGTSGGTITMVTAVVTDNDIVAYRVTPDTQLLDLAQGASWNAENAETAWDKLTKIVNELRNRVDRCFFAPQSDPASINMELADSVARAEGFLFCDSDGNPTFVTAIDAGSVVFGSFGEDVAGTATEAAFKTLANLVADTDYNAFSASLDEISSLATTNGNFIVGNGSAWVAESGNTAMASLGLTQFARELVILSTAAAMRSKLEVLEADNILVYEGAVLTYEGDVLTWEE